MVELIHKDEAFLAVNKPTNLLTVPGRGPEKQDCLYHRLLETYPDVLMVHRLDMDTSGLTLFACTPEAQRNLSMQFEKREISKTYVAVVEGVLKEDKGLIDLPMRKDMEQSLPPKHMIDHEQGKPALTEWHVLQRNDHTTRLALSPKTGRSHQLRLHLQSIGHPIVGDPIYGTAGDRLMLHAQTLVLWHPANNELTRLECPSPF